MLRVEVVYALREEQVLIPLEVEEGTTAREAVERSGILQRLPGIDVAASPVGVFGRIVSADAPLREGDRVELYRPLRAPPGDARRSRARRRG
jgi:putative ubiquitin-RnfH superfamily antitoxin RatB of RatAB toxin-antitoxin module